MEIGRKITIIAAFFMLSGVSAAGQETALEAVKKMYMDYFGIGGRSGSGIPEMKFSADFNSAIAENRKICAEYGYGICGWGSDGNEYLDTQDPDPGLTFVNSGIKFEDHGNNFIGVKLDIYPSDQDCGSYCLKNIKFKMVNENGHWVIDDIYYTDGVSSRKKLARENELNMKNPDPDSPFAKRKN